MSYGVILTVRWRLSNGLWYDPLSGGVAPLGVAPCRRCDAPREIMEIRSVTLFCEPGGDPAEFAPFLAAARGAFPWRVQSTRVGATPFPDWLPRDRAADGAAACATGWRAAGADYVSLGPVGLHHDPAWLELIPDLLLSANGIFASVEIATPDGRIDIGRCHATARLIPRVSAVSYTHLTLPTSALV